MNQLQLLPLLAVLLVVGACESVATTSVPDSPGAASATAGSTPAASPNGAGPAPPAGLTVATVTRIVDGDTIEINVGGETQKLRYIGMDTPETVDPRRPVGCFGKEASEHNRQLVEGKQVGLEKDVSETDEFGRLLRYVWLDGEMVNAVLVRDGYAKAATYPPDVKYESQFLALQAEARDAGRGLWGAVCATTPAADAGSPAAGGCDYSHTDQPVIKGNISVSSGAKIYHVPGDNSYDQTVIDPAKGERWFCTEAEAVAAGWRKSSS